MFQISVLSRCKQIPPRKSMYACIYECPCNIWFHHRVLFPLCFLAINYGNISLISWFSILNQVNLMECLCHHDICYQQKHPLSIPLSLITWQFQKAAVGMYTVTQKSLLLQGDEKYLCWLPYWNSFCPKVLKFINGWQLSFLDHYARIHQSIKSSFSTK